MRHPIHPMLVHFPISCWSLATVADLLSLFYGEPSGRFAGLLMLTGLIVAIPAMLAGLIDMTKIEGHSPAVDIVNLHMILVLMSWSLYALSLFVRMEGDSINPPDIVAIGLSVAGFILLGGAGWLGGKMVYEHGVGVSHGHENAEEKNHDETYKTGEKHE